jgi:hypothetical protein
LGDLTMAERIKSYQAKKLREAFPQYDANIVAAYGEAIAMIDDKPTIQEEQLRMEALASAGEQGA